MSDHFLLNDIKSLRVSDVLQLLEESFQKRLYAFKRVNPSIVLKPLYCRSNIEDYSLKDVTNGVAFMSNIMRLEIYWKMSTIQCVRSAIEKSDEIFNLEDILLKRVIVKVPRSDQASTHFDKIFDNPNEAQSMDSPEAIDHIEEALENNTIREIKFYTDFSSNHPELKIPKFYGYKSWDKINKDGIILMEDLGRNPSFNYYGNDVYASIIPMVPGFNDKQVLSIIEELAKIQAASANLPMEKKSFVCENFCIEGVTEWIKTMYFMAEAAFVEKMKIEEFADKIKRSAPIYCRESLENVHYRFRKKNNMHGIFVHNDLWAANILFKKSKTGSFDKVHGIVDWQTLNLGNPMADIARLLAFNTTAKYRRENEERLLEYYRTIFNNNVTDKSKHLSKENIMTAYKESLPLVLIFFAFSTPLYYYMDFINSGTAEEIKNKREELINRTSAFYDDVLGMLNL